MAGFRHVMDGLGIEIGTAHRAGLPRVHRGMGEAFVGPSVIVHGMSRLVQLCASATGKPLTDDELRLIAAYPDELSLLYTGLMA